jgi:chromate transporter
LKNIYLQLFLSFFKIGGFTIGGGYSMLPLMESELVNKRKWATEEELLNYYAIGQSTPGIIAINTATFIGYKTKGILGGIIATLGMITPSLIIIMSIASMFNTFNKNIYIQKAFLGIRIAVVVLIINAIYKMGKKSIKNLYLITISILSFLSVAFFNISPIIVIIVSASIGIIISLLNQNNERTKNKC